MKKKEIELSKEFKTQTTKAIIALGLFVLTYLIIFMLAILLTGLCVAGGILLIATKPTLFTIAFGIGLASLGILILIFLLKFIFKSHEVDRSHLIEINETNEPTLFNMIKVIVLEVGTSFPKKVYLSSDVNASVFYDSSFWSMFLPMKKNLQIGLGLVNTITKEELKAILAHEFGHFSQRTMKVGSYVYNVNQVIYNMLYENESYDSLIEKWANVSGYFSIFVAIAVKINGGIQWILRKMYNLVNKSYMGLSREMEFHADEIAAGVTGYQPLKNSLLRIALADNSYNNAVNFYSGKISENLMSDNIYKDQSSVIHFLAEVNSLNFKNNLPNISLEEQSKFDKSKLVIKDQWASHPTIEERITRLEKNGQSREYDSDTLANNIFSDINKLQKQLTAKLFEGVSYSGETKIISSGEFIQEYKHESISNSFSKVYNGYYDNKNPSIIDLSQSMPNEIKTSVEELFSDEKVDLVYTAIALQNDIETLKNISNRLLSIKTFDYDGIKYKRKDANSLIEKLNTELENTNRKIKINDSDIYWHFKEKENEENKIKELERLYHKLFEFDKIFDSKYDIYVKLLDELQFVNMTTPFEQIKSNFNKIKPKEEILKKEIVQLISDNIIAKDITQEIKHNLEYYISKSWEYFGETKYKDENLSLLFTALHNYAFLLSRKYFLHKKALLTYQEEFLNNQTHQLGSMGVAEQTDLIDNN